MAVFVNDPVTQASDLTNNGRVVTGGTWTAHSSSDDSFGTGAGFINGGAPGGGSISVGYFGGGNPVIGYLTGTPSGANYYVDANIRLTSAGSGARLGVCGRMSTSANTYYVLDYIDHATSGSRKVELRKFVAGTETSLGSYTVNFGTTTTAIRLEMVGTTIKGYVAGVERISVTDSDITAVGKVGIRGSGLSSSLCIDDITADYVSAATPAQISGSSSAAATGSLSLGTGTPPTFSLSSTATATGSLGLSAAGQLPLGQSTATATGSLDLTTTSAVGSRAAPGWLGLFVLDDTAASVPLIAGGSTASATGSLSLLVPSPRLITGTSTATATGTLTLRSSVETRIATPTSLGSVQFGNSTLGSVQFGNSTVQPAVDHPVS